MTEAIFWEKMICHVLKIFQFVERGNGEYWQGELLEWAPKTGSAAY